MDFSIFIPLHLEWSFYPKRVMGMERLRLLAMLLGAELLQAGEQGVVRNSGPVP